MARAIRWGVCTGAIAAASLTLAVTPAHAATGASLAATSSLTTQLDPVPRAVFDANTFEAEANASHWRGRRGWHRRGWRRHHRRGVSAGDVIAGVAILGGIAAIASAASNNRDRHRDRYYDRRERDREWRERQWQREREIDDLRRRMEAQERELEYLRERRLLSETLPSAAPRPAEVFDSDPIRDTGPIDIDTAIDRCVEVIEIDAGVSSVDAVERTDTGWAITGRIEDGESFICRVGSEGQIRALQNGIGSSLIDPARLAADRPAPGQWSRGSYADARASLASSGPDAGLDRIPAYPGGPLPGDVFEETGG